MMAQLLTAKPVRKYAQPGKEKYEVAWTISNWQEVRKSESLVNCEEAVFETGSSPSAWFKTKWLVGLKVFSEPSCYNVRRILMYWKLLDIIGPRPQAMKVEAKLETQLWDYTAAAPKYTDEKSRVVKILETVEEDARIDCLQFNPDSWRADAKLLGVLGMIRYKLKLTLTTPEMKGWEFDRLKMDEFHTKSLELLQQNQAAMLAGHSKNADLKILTSDGIEIQAHKAILEAQCPVFAAMFNCDLSDKDTGIIRMTDISGYTMKLLLRYFYTGKLLPSWSDPDTIAEFTYAAGKYQMTAVLEMLDDMLGRNSLRDAGNLDVQLLNLAGKLKLVKAETRLLERVAAKVQKVEKGDELFKLFGFEDQEISKMAGEEFGESKILKTMNYLYGANYSEVDLDKGMNVLAKAQRDKLGKLEENLLKCFAEKVVSVKNADELFQVFGCGKLLGKYGSGSQ